MAAVAAVATLCSWGAAIWLSPGHADFEKWLPWQWLTNLPVLDDVESVHFVALADLAVAVTIAAGIGAVRSWRVWAQVPRALRLLGLLVLCGTVAVMAEPVWSSYRAPLAVEKVRLPPWYATTARTVAPGAVIASYPFPASAAAESRPMVWQAADGMRFRLAGGYAKVPGRTGGVIGTGPRGSATWTLDALTLAYGRAGARFQLTAAELSHLRVALRNWHASYIVVADTGAAPVEAAGVFTAVTGTVPLVSHRAWVWDLRHRSVPPPADAAQAATAFGVCRSFAPTLGVVPADVPLPQAVNRCVVSGGHP
jgi:hypothetical protein